MFASWMPSVPAIPSSNTMSARVCSLGRFVALVSLLAFEVIGLQIRFDCSTLADGQVWGAALLRFLPSLLSLLMATATATLLFGIEGKTQWSHVHRVAEAGPGTLLCCMVAHLATFAWFAWLTAAVFEGHHSTRAASAGLVIGWSLTGLASLVFWLGTAVPLSAWRPLLHCAWPAAARGLVFGGLAWAVGVSAQTFWPLLRWATFWVSHCLLRLGFTETVCRPDAAELGIADFSVEIAPMCSGIEGMGLALVLLAGCLYVFRQDYAFPRALMILPLGVTMMWLANVLRIVLLIVIGHVLSPRVALGGFHSQAGWLAFNAVCLGLCSSSRRLSWLGATTNRGPVTAPVIARADASLSPTDAYLAPLAALLSTTLLTSALADGLDWLYPARVLAVAVVLWLCRRGYADLRPGWSWSSIIIGIIAFGVWIRLEPIPCGWWSVSAPHELRSVSGVWATIWLVMRIAGATMTVPIAEELAFRGFLSRWLIARDFETVRLGQFTWFSFLGSSILFGLLHVNWLAGTLLGLLYALAYYRRGRVMDAILAHATTNALMSLAVLSLTY